MNDQAFEMDEFDGELELFADQESDFETLDEQQYESGISEDEETELAAELLTLSSDRELDQFLGKLFRGVKAIANTPAGQKLKGLLRNTAKKAVPLGGQAIGSYFGGERGGAIGSKAGDLAAQIFRLELEGMSPEDQELEVARQFVRLAGDAAQNVAAAPRNGNPAQTAKTALAQAAERYAPGLLRNGGSNKREASGRWYRRGGTIVLIGA